jgi:uncharacterized protein YdeI (YjbR/CyaY-like superfamily)
VRCYKVRHGDHGLTYREALDEALCFGWIDGVRHGLDAISFTVRFTPRTPDSVWSEVNVRRAEELAAAGRMREPGAEAFARRRQASYSYQSRPAELAPRYLKWLEADGDAWRFFTNQPAWYRRTSAFWVMCAKREATRDKRFRVLLACSAAGEPIPLLRRSPRRVPPGHEAGV